MRTALSRLGPCRPARLHCRQFSFSSLFGPADPPQPLYPGHVPLTAVERIALTVRTGLSSFWNPRRADHIAAFGELTAQPYFLSRLRDTMLSDPVGRQILRDRPVLSSTTLPLSYLSTLPPRTVGGAYAAWLKREKLSQDNRSPVQYVTGPNGPEAAELAYVMRRYRESHDMYHAALTDLPTVREGEVALKLFEFANTGLPMTGLAVAAALTMKPAERARFWATFAPWAVVAGARARPVINVYWERELETDLDELRARLRIEPAPDMRAMRAADRARAARPSI